MSDDTHDWHVALNHQLDAIEALMRSRHAKYGPGNIAEFGPTGILVRLSDKFARLKAGHGNFDDETVADTLNDVIGYALIWKLWLAGDWPGSEPEAKRCLDPCCPDC